MRKLKHPKDGSRIFASAATAKALREEGFEDVAGQPVVAAPDPISEAPAKSAGRKKWDDYAESIGLDPEAYSSKDEVIAAVEAAGVDED